LKLDRLLGANLVEIFVQDFEFRVVAKLSEITSVVIFERIQLEGILLLL